MADPDDIEAQQSAEAQVDNDLTADDATILQLQAANATLTEDLAEANQTIAAQAATIATLQGAGPVVQKPGQPTSLVATPGNGQVVLSWAAPVDGGPVTDYSATSAPGGVVVDSRGSLTATVTGLVNGTAYIFSVVGTNDAGTGLAATVTATPSAPIVVTPPPVATGLAFPKSTMLYTPLAKRTLAASQAPATTLQAKVAANIKALTANLTGWCAKRYLVTSATPLVPVTVNGSSTGDDIPTWTAQLPWPAGATPDPSQSGGFGDHSIQFFNPTTGEVWELYDAAVSGSSYSCAQLAYFNPANPYPGSGSGDSNGIFHRPANPAAGKYSTCTASGITQEGTYVKLSEMAAGVIPHALLMALPITDGAHQKPVAPALYSDGNTSGGLPEGYLFGFPPGTPMPSGLCPFEQAVFTAYCTYGCYLGDTSGSYSMVYGENSATGWTQYLGGKQPYQLFQNFPWSKLAVYVGG